MKIDGKFVAAQIKENLKKKISLLKQRNITPHLAVILIGNDPSSEAYVRQKLRVGEEIGAKVSLYQFKSGQDTRVTSIQYRFYRSSILDRWKSADGGGTRKKLVNLVKKLNNDNSIHGIIIQRPCPIDISKEELDRLVTPQKDVDGFHPKSPFTPPIASAVLKILEWVHKGVKTPRGWQAEVAKKAMTPPMVEEFSKNFIGWLKKQKILVIGRGETAGRPIANTLIKMGINPAIAHSKTTNLKELCLKSDIIISCVGKRPILRRTSGRLQNGPYIVRHNMVKNSTLLIGVGLHQKNGKLAADYDQEEIAEKVAFYTPVPGGIGPVNVACLFENLVISCETAGGSF